MKGFTEKVIAEFSTLQLVEEKWESLEPALCFKWVEEQPAPFSDNEVEIDLSMDQVTNLAKLLNDFIEAASEVKNNS